ncbi:MAG TPA: DUF2269 family protein [Acidimicrobiia bacterium]|jgi:hypothetical protein|nr:DUF2269 family protein [Acidimicrobiia bacterium]
MTLRDVLLTLHIAGAGTWLGANVVQAVVPPAAARAGQQTLAGWYRITSVLARRLYMPAAVLVLLTGIFMVLGSDSYSFGSTFVTIGFAMIVVGAVLGMVVFGPGGEKAADALETGDQGAAQAATSRLARWGVLDTLLLLVTIMAMVLRLD